MSRYFLIFLFLLLSAAADARMYQWVDPDNGTTQLSGKPPVWYRSSAGGPRVFVFDNGKLVDDTGVEVSDVERDQLRQQALVKAMEDRAAARDQLLEARRLQALLVQEEEQSPEIIIQDDPDENVTQAPEANDVEEQETIEQMRALIQEWEQRRTQSARDLVNP